MKLSEHRAEGTLVIHLAGRLDSTNSDGAAQQLLGYIERGELKLVLDLSGLEYVSSTGLRVFLLVAKKMKSADGKAVLCGLNDMVMEIFLIAGFAELFLRFPTMDHATKAMK